MPHHPSAHIVLVEPEIHWNTGNAGRSCLAANAQLHLVRPLGFSLDDRQIRRSGLHYWSRVEPKIWSTWEALESTLPELGQAWFLSRHASTPIQDVDLSERPVLVFGSESRGLNKRIHERYRQRLIRLPLVASHDISLNLSTAVGIGLYETLRQQAARAQA